MHERSVPFWLGLLKVGDFFRLKTQFDQASTYWSRGGATFGQHQATGPAATTVLIPWTAAQSYAVYCVVGDSRIPTLAKRMACDERFQCKWLSHSHGCNAIFQRDDRRFCRAPAAVHHSVRLTAQWVLGCARVLPFDVEHRRTKVSD
jgi:hypothetical protein